MSWKILVNDGMESSGISALIDAGFEVDTQKIPQDELIHKICNYEGIIVRSATKVRKDLIDACPGLMFIARGGVGLDNIDVDYAIRKGIQVINTPAASSRSVAELAMGHILTLTRRLQLSNRELKGSEQFGILKKSMASCTEVTGKTLFIVGFGRIGKELAKMAIAMNMNVIVHDPFLKEAQLSIHLGQQNINLELPLVSLEHGLSDADYISLHSPFIGKPILDKEAFECVKKGAYIINTSRGENIDEDQLLSAIHSGKIAGAGLDVFNDEPNINPLILSNPKISVSPHIGASTQEAQERIAVELVEKIIALKGK